MLGIVVVVVVSSYSCASYRSVFYWQLRDVVVVDDEVTMFLLLLVNGDNRNYLQALYQYNGDFLCSLIAL